MGVVEKCLPDKWWRQVDAAQYVVATTLYIGPPCIEAGSGDVGVASTT